MEMQDDYVNFKHLLEFFVVYLEYLQGEGKEKPQRGERYQEVFQKIKSLDEKGELHKSGQGYQGHRIQDLVKKWEAYSVDGESSRICITAYAAKGYDANGNYLHWEGSYLNIQAFWEGEKENRKISSLYFKIGKEGEAPKDAPKRSQAALDKLGLFDGNGEPGEVLKRFFDEYCNLKKLKDLPVELFSYAEILLANYNLILTGAPGTGKSHLAKELARAIIGEKDESWKSRFGFVQFHPSYDYTDFVEGLRPAKPKDKKGQDGISFECQDGIFKEFCKRAAGDKNHRYVFVIDEINRGDLSKIFGELFFSIDPGYRGDEGRVKTQYSNLILDEEDIFADGFYVPENVYLIGTMNDIDRNVESMDFAIRRRFAWKEIEPTKEYCKKMFDNVSLVYADEAVKRIEAINKVISEEKFLGSTYRVGPAYFLKLKEYFGDFGKLWNLHIRPLLEEYTRGMRNEDREAFLAAAGRAFGIKNLKSDKTADSSDSEKSGSDPATQG